jgi:hypothetical protein
VKATDGPPRCLAVGSAAERGLEDCTSLEAHAVPDVHEALWELERDGRQPVLVEAAALEPRPRAALRALVRAARPQPGRARLPAGAPPPRPARSRSSCSSRPVHPAPRASTGP